MAVAFSVPKAVPVHFSASETLSISYPVDFSLKRHWILDEKIVFGGKLGGGFKPVLVGFQKKQKTRFLKQAP